jgi:hypothetical protein
MTCQAFSKTIHALLLVAPLVACASNIPTERRSQADAERIATLCGGGLSKDTRASLSLAYEKWKGNLAAGFENDVKAAILDDENIASSDRVSLAKIYIECARDVEAR